MRKSEGVAVVPGYAPGCIGRIVELHMAYYGPAWGFGLPFERIVAGGLADFFGRFDPARDGFWTARLGGTVEGGIAVAGNGAGEEGPRIRWFIVSDALRGRGAGGLLLDAAMDFLREKGFRRAHLHTFVGLDPARRLYEKAGFKLASQHKGMQWGREVEEQVFVWEARHRISP